MPVVLKAEHAHVFGPEILGSNVEAHPNPEVARPRWSENQIRNGAPSFHVEQTFGEQMRVFGPLKIKSTSFNVRVSVNS